MSDFGQDWTVDHIVNDASVDDSVDERGGFLYFVYIRTDSYHGFHSKITHTYLWISINHEKTLTSFGESGRKCIYLCISLHKHIVRSSIVKLKYIFPVIFINKVEIQIDHFMNITPAGKKYNIIEFFPLNY